MKIAVNTRLLLKNKLEGIGWFTYETLKRVVQKHPEIEFVFIFDREPSSDFIFSDNVSYVVAHPQARHPILWFLFFEVGVFGQLKKIKPDLFLSPDGWLSLRSEIPQLAVIHDLNFEHFPEFIPWHVRKYYHYFFPRFARKAKRIATVSEYTRQDISERYGINPKKIDVVYNGVDPGFQPFSTKEIERIRMKYAEGKPYFLFVGLIHPRKNLKNQVLAFLDFKEKSSSDLKYLVVGSRYEWDESIDKAIGKSPWGKDVKFLGRMGKDELIEIYGGAFALTYVSYFEGFGIPIIEAMQSGVPVITSHSSSMPEVAGEAALIVDPSSFKAISEAMETLWSDHDLYNQLRNNGMDRAKKFSWDKAAENLFKSILEAVKE